MNVNLIDSFGEVIKWGTGYIEKVSTCGENEEQVRKKMYYVV